MNPIRLSPVALAVRERVGGKLAQFRSQGRTAADELADHVILATARIWAGETVRIWKTRAVGYTALGYRGAADLQGPA